MTPKKPNSPLPKYPPLPLSNNIQVNPYIPPIPHNLQQHTLLLLPPPPLKHLPALPYHILPPPLHTSPLHRPTQPPSLYPTKKPKN
ncbi:uS12 family ribosomal protein, partial [Staphylococcus epidermidis]